MPGLPELRPPDDLVISAAGVALFVKRCTKCGIEYPATARHFPVRARSRTLDSWCRSCKFDVMKRNAAADPDLARARHADYRLRIKMAALVAYGGNPPTCACCREDKVPFLAIDHIGGGGGKHRVAVKRTGQAFYLWLAKQGWPPGFRVLCHNCNMAWGRYGNCPHQNPLIGVVDLARMDAVVVNVALPLRWGTPDGEVICPACRRPQADSRIAASSASTRFCGDCESRAKSLAPLRMVVERDRLPSGIGAGWWVLLECGHRVDGLSTPHSVAARKRCRECVLQPDAGPS